MLVAWERWALGVRERVCVSGVKDPGERGWEVLGIVVWVGASRVVREKVC